MNDAPARLWMVVQVRAATDQGPVSEFQGVFDSEDRAVAACRSPSYCVMPVTLNESLPDESFDHPGAYYPHARAAGIEGEPPNADIQP